MTSSSRRSFISNLATVATAAAVAPLANALPSDKDDAKIMALAESEARARNAALNGGEAVAPKRAAMPLEWIKQKGFFGVVLVGSYLRFGEEVHWSVGEAKWSHWAWIAGIVNTEAEARAAIQLEWDKLCNAEPVAAQPAPKVKALEWKMWDVREGKEGIIAHPAPQQYLIIYGGGGKYHIVSSANNGCQPTLPVCDTLESAKTAAQAHWNSIVLGALDA